MFRIKEQKSFYPSLQTLEQICAVADVHKMHETDDHPYYDDESKAILKKMSLPRRGPEGIAYTNFLMSYLLPLDKYRNELKALNPQQIEWPEKPDSVQEDAAFGAGLGAFLGRGRLSLVTYLATKDPGSPGGAIFISSTIFSCVGAYVCVNVNQYEQRKYEAYKKDKELHPEKYEVPEPDPKELKLKKDDIEVRFKAKKAELFRTYTEQAQAA